MEINSQIEFYRTVSQIIPVLFLSISIQSAFIIKNESYQKGEELQRNVHVLTSVTIFILLAISEYVVLRDIYINNARSNDLKLVSLSLVTGTMWIIIDYILSLIGRSKEIYFAGFMIIGILLNILVFWSL